MTLDIVVPQVGEAVADVTLVSWMKKPGDAVRKGETLFEVDTDKAIVEVEAYADGVLAEILVPPGSSVRPQQVVGLLAAPGTEVPAQSAEPAQPQAPPVRVPGGLVTPMAARVAAELGVDVSHVRGSGRGGRISAQDVRNFARQAQPAPAAPPARGRVPASPKARRLAAELGVDLNALTGSGPDGLVTEHDVQAAARGAQAAPAGVRPLSKLRRAIAGRMAHSKQTVPHFYLAVDADMTQCDRLRAHCQEELAWPSVPSFTDIIVRASALALQSYPGLNVTFTEQGLAPRSTVDVGVAVAVPEGLLVPVLAQADQLSLRETSEQVRALAERARAGRLRESDLASKSLVVSNLGMYGIDEFVAIIDPPDPLILAVGRVADRVVAVEGQPAVRRMCSLWLSADHRVLDGVQGAQFFTRVQQILEAPFDLLGSLQ